MGLLYVSVAQLAVCLLSFLCRGILGDWIEFLPWRFVIPLGLGCLWSLLTVNIIMGSRVKTPFISVAIIELPFAFGWPAWFVLYSVFGH